jgi:hypothetical protein
VPYAGDESLEVSRISAPVTLASGFRTTTAWTAAASGDARQDN